MTIDLDATRLPIGTVTFMFTDIEGSTRLLSDLGDQAYSVLLERHHALVREAIRTGEGVEVTTDGDAFFAVFVDPVAAVETASTIQRNLADASWERPLRVRIGVHTGAGVLGAENYVGVDVHRAQRVADAGHGGQVVLSGVTASLVESRLPSTLSVEPLGRYSLAGFAEPMPLHQLVISGLEASFPQLRARPAESMLPKSLSDFVGREREIDSGLSILGAHRLLTLTGPGGTGKTRLSLEIAYRIEREFADGAYFVPLAPLTDPELIPATILQAIGLETTGGTGPMRHLLSYMSEREVLLLLDNFEHLPTGASFVAELLMACPRLQVIATSRAPLKVNGEQELPVPPLPVPAPGIDVAAALESDGVRLFLNRAQAVRPGFDANDSDLAAIAGIVRALDGLPLAIELAASRTRILAPESILERIGNQILASHSADRPERQQTMVNAIGWSYDLLSPHHRELFEQLSVFSGTFGLAEAEAICRIDADLIDGITELVEQSLLRRDGESSERFRMLTVIKEFAHAALMARGDSDEVFTRHASVYADLAERSHDEILTSRQGLWLQRLAEDHDNIRAALDHCFAVGDTETALRIVGGVWRFWQIRGLMAEARSRIEKALSMPGSSDTTVRARALTALGGILYWQGKWEETKAPYEEALRIYREVGTEAEIAEALYNYSFPVGFGGDVDEARALLRESLALSEREGRILGIGRAHWGLANQGSYVDEWPVVLESMEIAVEYFSKIDAPYDLGWTWFMVAHARFRLGEIDLMKAPAANALEIFARVGDLSALSLILEMLSTMLLVQGDRSGAAFITGAAERIKTDTGVAIVDVELNRYPVMIEFLQTMDEMDRVFYEEGYSAELDEVVSRARAAFGSGE